MPSATGLRTVGASYDSPLTINTSIKGGLKEAYAEVWQCLLGNWAAERPTHVVVELLGQPPIWRAYDEAASWGQLGLP